MPFPRLLIAWVLFRVPAVITCLGLAAFVARSAVLARLAATTDVHGIIKAILEGWHAALLHLPLTVGIAIVLAAAGGLAPLATGRTRRIALGATLGVLIPLVGLLPTGGAPAFRGFPPTALALLGFTGANLALAGRAWPRALLHIPGLEWLFPLPTLGALGLLDHAALRALLLLPLAALYAAADAGLGFRYYEAAVADWPDSRTEARLEILARAAPGVRREFHDIDIVATAPGADAGAPPSWRAVVIAETSLKLWSLPSSGATSGALDLPPWWGPDEGLVMDSETDPATDTTWFLDGPAYVSAAVWDGGAGAWRRVARSEPLPVPLTHTYTRWIPERQQLVLASINARDPRHHPIIQTLRTPQLDRARGGEPWLDTHVPLPTTREIAWIPPLDRLVLAPDFGDRLYLVNLDTWHAEPWVTVPTQDGKLEWVPGYQRLVVAVPGEPWIHVIDPVAGRTERRIPTQLGVRAIAVDPERGLILTASVLTGQVLVQRWADGAVVDRFGTVMPMVRELRLIPGSGEAVLGTWTRLYRFRYAP